MFKLSKQYIPAYIKFFINVYTLNLFVFFVERLIFYYYNKPIDASNISFSDKLSAYKVSLEFDSNTICYIFLIPFVLFTLTSLFNYKKGTRLIYLLLMILQAIVHFVFIADIPFFRQFGTHLNRTAFLWSNDTNFAIGVIFGSFMYWGFFLIYIPIILFLFYISRRFYRNYLHESTNFSKHYYSVCSILVILLMAIGIRGRITDRSGLEEGIAIVSENAFVNQLALNPNFTFWKSVLFKASNSKYQTPKNINASIAFTQRYLGIKTPNQQLLTRPENDSVNEIKKYNFVVVVMESMCLFKMGYYNGKNLTPNLDRLNKESIFFSNFFSSGIHTFNGLFSTTSGYPSIYEEQGLKSYVKKPFDGLGSLLQQLGYENYFYTTHDPHFDNMQGFFRFNKFEHIISKYDFDYSQSISSLGVPDHVLLNKLIEVTNQRKSQKPFLSVVMTASDHGPWKIPEDISYKPQGETPQENCTLYADWAIGQFIEKAKQQSWYNNTVFIFLGDHGLSMGHTYEMPLSYHHIPCIIHQPNLFKADTISSPSYQPDIPATVMGIIGAPYINNTFGIDILKEKHPFVVFSADNKIGCVNDQGFYFYKTLDNQKTYLRKYATLNPHNFAADMPNKADSMQQNMMHIYNTANDMIRKNYFLYE